MSQFDFLIIGTGIAGASTGAQLAPHARVAMVERESQHGYHTTGRSAALWSALYGNEQVRALTVASRRFYDVPPSGFADHPLLTDRGCLYFAAAHQTGELDDIAGGAADLNIRTQPLDEAQARAMCPVLIPGAVAGALFEPDAMDIDVDSLHQGFLRMARAAGAVIRTDAGVERLERAGGIWRVTLASGETLEASVVINAAGAWADKVGAMAGADSVGLQPLLRTAFILDQPSGVDATGWPIMIEAEESFYFKPQSGRILVSPCDETPSEPCDAWADDMTIAECVERLQQAADIPVRRVVHSWAGLRSFVPDRGLVIGWDPKVEGLFWVAGQGGYGMQTAPAAGMTAAALALGRDLPSVVAATGLTADRLSPARLRV